MQFVSPVRFLPIIELQLAFSYFGLFGILQYSASHNSAASPKRSLLSYRVLSIFFLRISPHAICLLESLMSSTPSVASTACEPSDRRPTKIKDLEKSPPNPKNDSSLVGWDGDNDPENPQNWSIKRKWGITTAVSLFTFMVGESMYFRLSGTKVALLTLSPYPLQSPFASTFISPSSNQLAIDFDISERVVLELCTSIFREASFPSMR